MITPLKPTILLGLEEKRELREFASDIQYTRNRTIVESSMYSIIIYPNKNYYVVTHHASTARQVIKRKELTKGIKLISTNIPNNEIIFTYTGRPLNAGTIYLEDSKGKIIEISVTPVTGKVNIKYR